ncbi:hypothetical protein DPEC_G00179790 [Dallia pectoralis]|uniref:Uncharacterized protein n=1 Tax=Dallia pectoralis TaxID=75939 RepID=A0ACC2GFW8_DALPE|nr:hypothetical protein DPEC_G00179790 [Dallia pectoralis]
MPLGVQDELARDSFIRALAPTELCRHVQMAEPLSLRVAVEVARKRELIWGGGEDRQPEVRAVVAGGPEIVTPGWVDELSGLVKAATLVIEKGSRQRSNTSYTRMVCWRCGQSGHLQRDCDGGPVVVVGRTTVGDFCNIRIKVEGVGCLALVDTGSTVTLVRPDILPSGVRVEQTDVQLRTVTGELAPMLGKCRLSVTVGGKTVLCSMWVAAVQDPCILGMDFLKNCGAQLDLAAGTLRLLGGLTVGMLPSGGLAGNRAASAFSVKIGEAIPVVPSQQLSPAATPFTTLISTSTGSLGAQNTQAPSPKLTRSGGEETIKAVEAVWLKNCQGLEETQQSLLKELLLEFKDSFAWGEDEVGQTHLVQHGIDTGNA